MWCSDTPTIETIDQCARWDMPEVFSFTITESSVSPLDIPNLPAGTYTWIGTMLLPSRSVQAVAYFNRPMTGAIGVGKYCWTNGERVTESISLYREIDQNKWSANCGDSVPESIPENELILDNFRRGPSEPFVGESISGEYINYLLRDYFEIAESSDEVIAQLNFSRLANPVVVTGKEGHSQIFEITYDRSRGAEAFVDGIIGINNLSRILPADLPFTVEYSEIAN